MILYTPEDEDQDPKGFINNDQASDSSIGSGTSDQGIEPGYEGDDEFNHDITGLGDNDQPQPASSDNPLARDDEEANSIHRKPTHGLVEEGPGPDA